MTKMDLWKNIPGTYDTAPQIEYFEAQQKITKSAVVIFPGGGYTHLAPHEGEGFAKMLNFMGIDAFVATYRLAPNTYPTQLQDARRAIQFVRYHAENYDIDPDKIAVMGSSAGGHLAALVSGCRDEAAPDIPDEIDNFPYFPNYQILVYPVLDFTDDKLMHKGSKDAMLAEMAIDNDLALHLSPAQTADGNLPPAFIWHNADDKTVPVMGSIEYAKKLKEHDVPVEFHMYTHGSHGCGTGINMHCASWTDLLARWFREIGFIER